ncbi:hypothetical protein QBC44DRAFT_31562 [Cladorrhinum sp. PSN332]|nr:hypothetical protein QBC44DRAFT_31562 [Cladorrhinum sp. PSN332]
MESHSFSRVDPQPSEFITRPTAPPERAASCNPRREDKSLIHSTSLCLESGRADGQDHPLGSHCDPHREPILHSEKDIRTPRFLPTADSVVEGVFSLSLQDSSQTHQTAAPDYTFLPNTLHPGNSSGATRISSATGSDGHGHSRPSAGKRKATEPYGNGSAPQGGDDGDDDDDDYDGRPTKPPQNQQQAPTTKTLFGCPYRKRDPERFPCQPRCGKSFPNLSRVNHVRKHHSAQVQLDGITLETLLGVDARKKDIKANTWDKLWGVLFPDDTQIPSERYESCDQMRENYLQDLKFRVVDELQEWKNQISKAVGWNPDLEQIMQSRLSRIEEQFNTRPECGLLCPAPRSSHQNQQATLGRSIQGTIPVDKSKSKLVAIAPKPAPEFQHDIPYPFMVQPQVYHQPTPPYDGGPSSSYQSNLNTFIAQPNIPMSDVARPAPLSHLGGHGLDAEAFSDISTMLQRTGSALPIHHTTSPDYATAIPGGSPSPLEGDSTNDSEYFYQPTNTYYQN